MAYITYFDLLGTRGFCDNPQVYFENICTFTKAIKETAWLLKDFGKVGIFSDSAYAECSDLQYLLDFLVQLRNRLLSENLFFNAVVKPGELGVDPVNTCDESVAFGVAFKNSNIAELYIAQTNFKGIGINIDPSIYCDVIEHTNYKLTDCFYIQNKPNGYYPIAYKDISFNFTAQDKKAVERILRIVLRAMYTSYMKSPKFGTYYLSLFANLIRSCAGTFDWDMSDHMFKVTPPTFNYINNMIQKHYQDLPNLQGIEFLSLVLLDAVYNSPDLHEAEKNDITLAFTKHEIIRKHYLHSLNDIPSGLFSCDITNNINNRELFIKYCQNEMSDRFVDDILE